MKIGPLNVTFGRNIVFTQKGKDGAKDIKLEDDWALQIAIAFHRWFVLHIEKPKDDSMVQIAWTSWGLNEGCPHCEDTRSEELRNKPSNG